MAANRPRPAGLQYVATACTNCVRVHAACDADLPCQRCVRLGRTESCVRPEQPLRRWKNAAARTQRLVDRLRDALASSAASAPTSGSATADTSTGSPATAASKDAASAPPPTAATAIPALASDVPAESTAFVVNAAGTLLSASGLDPTVFGDTCASLVGRNVFTCIDPDDIGLLSRALSMAPKLPGIVVPLLLRFVNSAGQMYWVELAVAASDRAELGKATIDVRAPRTAVHATTTTTPAPSLEAPTLESSSARMSVPNSATSTIDNDHAPFLGFTFRHSFDGTILDMTNNVEAVLGYPPSMLLGTNVMALLQPTDILVFNDLLAKLVRGEHIRCMGRQRLLAREGELVWVEMHVCVVPSAIPGGSPSLMCTAALLSFLQELGGTMSIDCIATVRATPSNGPRVTNSVPRWRLTCDAYARPLRSWARQLPGNVTTVSDIAQAVYEQHEADRVEARLRDSSAAPVDESDAEPAAWLMSTMSAEMYHQYIGIDTFVDSWLLDQ